ncbi:MAG: urea transporter [Gemmataceae bacterium]
MANAGSVEHLSNWSKVTLRGVAEIVFQDNALTGLLFLIGLLFASPWIALGGLLGSLIGTAVAYLLKYDTKEWNLGIYGFNPALVGMALFFKFQPSVIAFMILPVACAASTVLTWLLRKLPFPTYTAAFILTTWLVFALGPHVGLKLPPESSAPDKIYNPHTVVEMLRESASGLAEIMFGAGLWTGLFFLAGLFVSNWRHGVLALLGSLVGTLIAHYHQDPNNLISIGIYGYNAALAAVAMYLWRPSLQLSMLGAILATPITEFFPQTTLPTLTAPFVVACWVIIALGKVDLYFNPQEKS